MKKIFLIVMTTITTFIYSNCAQPKITHYEGYVYTEEGQPISGLKVHPKRRELMGITDENGYFKIEISKDHISVYLEIELEGKFIDTTRIINLTPYPERRVFYRFINGKNDTLFIKKIRLENMSD